MAQTLKYVIGKDYRPLTVLEAKTGNVFAPDYDKSNWVQARQYEDSLRQVFVEITNEDGSAYDLTGANVLFEGILPDNEHKILDNSHVVFYEDPTAGKFRFDMPSQAFSVAGQYKQAFFRVMRDYRNVATLEFKFEVLADMVVSGLVPRDYISPLDDLFNTIKETETKNVADLKKIVDDKINEITDLMTTLNQTNSATLSELNSAKTAVEALQEKIKQDGLFTSQEANTLISPIQTEIERARESKARHTVFDNLAKRLDAIEARPTPTSTKIVDFATISVTYQPNTENLQLSGNEISHLKQIGLDVTVANMVGVDSLTSSTLNWNETNLKTYLSAIKSEGIEISMLKPHVGVNFSDGTNRVNFSPSNTTAWWENWQALLDVQAQICIDYEIPILCVGCEFASLTKSANKSNWKTICDFLHKKYPTLKLTYASVGGEFTSRENSDSIFPFIDYIGVNLYPRLTWRTIQGGESEATDLISEIVQGWSYDMKAVKWIEILDKLSERYQKPVLITETGVMPYPNGLNTFTPAEMTYQDTGDDVNNTQNYWTSSLFFRSLIESPCQLDCVKGFSIWHLGFPFNFAKKSQTDLSPAEEVLKNYRLKGLI